MLFVFFFFYERSCLVGLKMDSFLGNPPTMCKKKNPLKYLKDFEMEPHACQDMEGSAVLSSVDFRRLFF